MERNHKEVDVAVVLVSMPWAPVDAPSLQIGLLKSLLDQAGIRTQTAHFNVAFLDYVNGREGGQFQYPQYKWIELQAQLGLGEWAFAVPPFRPTTDAEDELYGDFLYQEARRAYPGLGAELASWFERTKRIRAAVPAFLQRCVAEILACRPQVVGFTCTYQQRLPALVLAQLLKLQAPQLRTVFGGANCSGDMGETLLRHFPWIDVVVRGEAEPVVAQLFQELVEGRAVTPQPGLCIRHGDGRLVCRAECDAPECLQSTPPPVYDEYFQRLANRAEAFGIRKVQIPYESSRGCWWGARCKCTFCGRDDRLLHFRSQTPERVFRELQWLAERYPGRELVAVDNIIDLRYVRELMPMVRDAGLQLSLFYQVRPTFTKDQLRAMRDAGLRTVFAGVESLSSPLLQVMQKGTTALGNIRFLKWCAELGISADWNLMYGLPGEQREHYDEMAETMWSLTHLQPPACVTRHVLCRHSRFFQNPRSYGLDALLPSPMYRFLLGQEKWLEQYAYYFDFRFVDGHDPETYVDSCRTVIDAWRADHCRSVGQLSFQGGADSLEIFDGRNSTGPAVHRLEGMHSQIYLACDAGRTVERILARLRQRTQRPRMDAAGVRSFLDSLVERRLAFRENGRYLSLAVPRLTSADERLPVEACALRATARKELS